MSAERVIYLANAISHRNVRMSREKIDYFHSRVYNSKYEDCTVTPNTENDRL